MRISLAHFIRSKSALALLMYLTFVGVVSVGVGYAFYNSSLDKFLTQKTEEKVTALRLVDAFVTTYSSVRSQLTKTAPVPATFRAHSIESFNTQVGSNNKFLIRWVGRRGRHIITPPADSEMAKTIEAFATKKDPKPVSVLSVIDDHLVFRTIYPSLAREQSCVDCHNQLQQGKPQWQLDDVMGAFAIDVPVFSFLKDIRLLSYAVGLLLFMSLATVGLVISILHFRQTSEREAAALDTRTQNIRLDAALNNMVQGLAMFDADERLVLCNARYAQIYGLAQDQVRPGTTLRQIIEQRISNGLLSEKSADEIIGSMLRRSDDINSGEFYSQLGDGRFIAIIVQPMPDGGSVTTHQDITEQRRFEAKIAYMAHHDDLTGLANRVKVRERLKEAVSHASAGKSVAVLCLDLDRFKDVNDWLGHSVGDALLKSVAERLRDCVGDTDTVARLGGDEFAVIQVGSKQPVGAAVLAARIIDSISAPHDFDGHLVDVGTSIGIAVSPIDGTDPDALMKNADLALYRAKNDGRGTHQFFEKGMDAQMQARRIMESDLRRALSNGEFELYYQPLISLQRNVVTGFEALLRWNHPERGRVLPVEFIPVAEDAGLIVPIGAWVLRQACAEAAGWPDHIKVAVNLSSTQFKSVTLVAAVFAALDASSLAPVRLELEITESVLLKDTERTLAMLHELHQRGVKISLDDFGTGYSSLSYLQSFPFDKIKIDQSFIRNINENTQSLAIVHAVSGLGVSLGIATTAEGVETKEQLDRVRAEGCTEVQGYYFSPPRPAGEVAALLSRMKKSELAA